MREESETRDKVQRFTVRADYLHPREDAGPRSTMPGLSSDGHPVTIYQPPVGVPTGEEIPAEDQEHAQENDRLYFPEAGGDTVSQSQTSKEPLARPVENHSPRPVENHYPDEWRTTAQTSGEPLPRPVENHYPDQWRTTTQTSREPQPLDQWRTNAQTSREPLPRPVENHSP
ncbi:hypothetical protein EYF80_014138 [Liparis tanakae]|uniref:Uncharacterized protein n=1 Tax=Liparis tanakae TaxID=230148 RepID=A0A4Z2IC47_9TELE|nr:hypothetical protein EYF80_014138 [Liparis tanakae]